MTREEALNVITAFVENYACGSDLDGLREAIEALKEKRPQGKWIEIKDEDGIIYCGCSVCKWENEHWQKQWVACPNCGADMRKRGEAE